MRRVGARGLHSTSEQSRSGLGWLLWWNGMVSADQVHLLRKSFDIVERHPEVAALVFYKELFLLEPRLRGLFQADISEQAR